MESKDAARISEAALKIAEAGTTMSAEQGKMETEINDWFSVHINEPMLEVEDRLEAILSVCSEAEKALK